SDVFEGVDLQAKVGDPAAAIGAEPYADLSENGHSVALAAVPDGKTGEVIGYAAFAWTLEPMRAQIADARLVSIVAGAVAMAATLGVVATLLRAIVTKPLLATKETMTRLADGDVGLDIPGLDRADEIGAMSKALAVFRDTAVRAAEVAEEKAKAEQEAARSRMEMEKKEADAKAAAAAREAERIEREAAEQAERAEAEARRAREEEERRAAARKLAEEERARMMDRLRDSFGAMVEAAARGDFTARVEADFDDETLNELAHGLNKLAKTVGEGLGETCEMLGAIGRYDLSERVRGDFQGDFLRLKTGVNQTADTLTEILSELGQASAALRGQTNVLGTGINDLSSRTADQASKVEETSAAVDMLTRSVRQTADRAAQARDKASEAERLVGEGGGVMKQATGAMDRVVRSSEEIADIVSVIDGIAFQTNLLSLNASVEAARAGEAGKGFAVVAAEVRNLAQSAANSSNDIRSLIERSREEVLTGVEHVGKAAENLDAVVASIGDVSGLMSEISDDAAEQATRLSEVNDVVTGFDQATQNNAQMVDRSLQALDQASTGVGRIEEIAGSFVFE
ncbi:MAG: methyl-accepting chemotaxis protein, partial [Pseudomonadota bacterium]